MGCPSWRAFLTGGHDVAAVIRFREKVLECRLGLLFAGQIDTLLGQERSVLGSLCGYASGRGWPPAASTPDSGRPGCVVGATVPLGAGQRHHPQWVNL
jgi:hypothetical protein